MKRNFIILFVLIPAFLFTACKNKKTTNENSGSSSGLAGSAVCIWDNVSLKEAPASDGKWLTSISLGEKCNYLGDEKEVSNNGKTTKYVKVGLKDGKQGWVQADFIVIEGKPGVILQDATVYSRPDLLTKTDKSFSKMDIVGVKGEQNDFIEIAGKRKNGKWIESGWIKPSNISYSEIDIAVAKYAVKALSNEDMEKKNKALNDILENSDLQSSVFIGDLKSMISPAEESAEDFIEKTLTDTTQSE